MHKNPVWIAFLIAIAAAVIGYSGWTIYYLILEYPSQKNIPFKEALYLFLSWAILAYFIILGYYVGKHHS